MIYDDVWWCMMINDYAMIYDDIFSVPLTSEDATATGWIGSSAARQDRTLSVLNCKVTFDLSSSPSKLFLILSTGASPTFQPLPNHSWGQGPQLIMLRGWGSERSWDEVSSGSGCTQLRATNRWSVSWLSKVRKLWWQWLAILQKRINLCLDNSVGPVSFLLSHGLDSM